VSRTDWCKPGLGSSLVWLCAIVGVEAPTDLSQDQLAAHTSLYLKEHGTVDARDAERVKTVIQRVREHGADQG